MVHTKRFLTRFILPAFVAATTVAAVFPTYAETFPEKPIRLLVPFGPGGITDTVARQLGQQMSEKLGQPIVIENKPSAGHVLSMQAVAQAKPDGYMLMLGSNTGFSVTPHLQKNISFSTDDFQLIAPVISSPPVLVARNDFPADTLTEFVDYARASPGKVTYGSYGMSSSAHLAMEILQQDAGLKLVHVPYKGDSSALTALLGKQVDVALLSMFSAQSRIQNKEIKALGVFQADRFATFPDVQIPSEIGSPKAGLPIWLGLFAPAGTPSNVVATLEKSAREVISSSEFKDFVRSRGSDAIEMPSDQFMKRIKDESDSIGQIVQTMGLHAQ